MPLTQYLASVKQLLFKRSKKVVLTFHLENIQHEHHNLEMWDFEQVKIDGSKGDGPGR